MMPSETAYEFLPTAKLPVAQLAHITMQAPRPRGYTGGARGGACPPGFWMGVINLTNYNTQLRQD